jgi:photosystem II stability/assembly factor-like uncharacterized protein
MRRLLVTGLVLVAIAGCTSSGHTASGGSSGGGVSTSPPAPSTSAASTTAAPSTSAVSSSTAAPAPLSFPLNGLQVADLSFVGNTGWALGTAGCVRTSGRCAVLARSTDGGRSWRSLARPPGQVVVPQPDTSCSAPCVEHVRFATTRVGYLFGPGAFYTTSDGGRTWQHAVGGADALESLDGNVIRVADSGGCPPGCRYTVTVAGTGATDWRTVPLPGATTGVAVALTRTGARAALEVFQNPAGGAGSARSTLWTSSDDGAHWTRRGEPCPQSGGAEVDSVALTSAPDGSFTVLCRVRSGAGRQFPATSTDGGAHFAVGSRSALGAAPVGALGAASARILLVSSDDTYRSTDGGRHFSRLSANAGSSPGALGWLGFASSTVGHAVSVDRRTIWTTTDAGHSWQAGRLH